MQKIPVQKWILSGNKDTFYDTLMDAVKDQKPGTILEQVIVVEEVEDPIDYAKLRRDKKAKELDEKGNPIEEDKSGDKSDEEKEEEQPKVGLTPDEEAELKK